MGKLFLVTGLLSFFLVNNGMCTDHGEEKCVSTSSGVTTASSDEPIFTEEELKDMKIANRIAEKRLGLFKHKKAPRKVEKKN